MKKTLSLLSSKGNFLITLLVSNLFLFNIFFFLGNLSNPHKDLGQDADIFVTEPALANLAKNEDFEGNAVKKLFGR